MADTPTRVSELLHEAGETHHQVRYTRALLEHFIRP
jgi:hypothetical protein